MRVFFLTLFLPIFTFAHPFESIKGSPALEEICADTVTAHPTKPGFWHLEFPRFAETETSVYTKMHVRPTEAGSFVLLETRKQDANSWTERARFQDEIQDLAVAHGSLWILFVNRLVEWDVNSNSVKSVTTFDFSPGLPAKNESAHAMTRLGDRLLIAKGTQGLLVYDPKAKGIVFANNLGLHQSTGHVSKVTSIAALDANRALLTVEAATVSQDPPFAWNGLMIVDLKGAQFSRYLALEEASGNLAQAQVKVEEGRVWINNWGYLKSLSIDQLSTGKKLGLQSHPLIHVQENRKNKVEVMGEFFIKKGEIQTCGQVELADEATHKINRVGIPYSSQVLNP